jgi:malate dehydrogenase
MAKCLKIAVTGAAGQIGYALVFRLASGHIFGPNVPIQLNLIEIPPALSALHGVAMELEDCAFPLLEKVVMTSGINEGFKDVDYAVLAGSMPRKQGMERSDLLEANGKIFKPQGQAINDHASRNVKVLVVGNPCNTNCLVAMNNAPDLSSKQFFAMTMLDQNRARAQLAIKDNVPVSAIHNMIIWGNHSSTQFPDFYNAKINGQSAVKVINNEKWFIEEFLPLIQERGAAVIKARGASSAASAANAIIGCLTALSQDSQEANSMACCSDGSYGVDPGLISSFPCITKNGEVNIVQGVQHNELARQKLQVTLDELRAERDAVKKLKLIKS